MKKDGGDNEEKRKNIPYFKHLQFVVTHLRFCVCFDSWFLPFREKLNFYEYFIGFFATA